MEWSQKRRILYALVFVGMIVVAASYPVYHALNPIPTCFDHKQNGDEAGMDCGGSCVLYCANQVKAPHVVWAKAFLTAPGRYDLGAYVENPNSYAGVKEAPYILRMLDRSGQVLVEDTGTTEIPPAGTFLLFAGNLSTSDTPDKVEVVFGGGTPLSWVKAQAVPLSIVTKNQSLINTDTKPRFDVTLLNTDLVNDVGHTTIGAIIYDALRHPVAISQTFVNNIPKGEEQDIFFTWPSRFSKRPNGGICTTPVDTMLVFDRSGSMDVGKKKPPEPLTTAKNAAIAYIEAADLIDKVGLVSFATTASEPIDHELSLNHESVKNMTMSISIATSSIQQTNLGDALKAAAVEFESPRHAKDAKRVIVALTDGDANRPLDPVNPKNTAYASEYAASQADASRVLGVEIYTIGLGKNISEKFLRDRIATDPAHYFSALTAKDLQGIYKKIAEAVCKEEGFITEIVTTPRAVFEN